MQNTLVDIVRWKQKQIVGVKLKMAKKCDRMGNKIKVKQNRKRKMHLREVKRWQRLTAQKPHLMTFQSFFNNFNHTINLLDSYYTDTI